MLGAYGRALADDGNYQQALDVLNRAHTPDQPDWRILSVQGAVLDQMGRHGDAQRHYSAALQLVPDEPSVLSNLGLSYALAKNLKRAGGDDAARRGAARRRARRCGRTSRLSSVCKAVSRRPRPSRKAIYRPAEAAANVAYLRQMLAQKQYAEEGKRDRPPPRPVLDATDCDPAPRSTAPSASVPAAITPMAAGPRITTNSTGRKNRIIGTVSLGGRRGGLLLGFGHAHVAVFLRHHAQRLGERRAVTFGLLERHADRLHAVEIGALGQVLVGLAAVLRKDSSAVVSVSSSASSTDCAPISAVTCGRPFRSTCRNSTQISIRSSASGKARMIDSCRSLDLALQQHQRQVHAEYRPRRCRCRA